MATFGAGVSFGNPAGNTSVSSPQTNTENPGGSFFRMLTLPQTKLGAAAPGLSVSPSAGVKATSPGGLSTGSTNGLASTYTAPKSNQLAVGNTTNANNTGSTGTTSSTAGLPPPAATTTGTFNGISGTPGTSLGGTTGQLIQSSLNGSPAAQGYTAQTAQYGAGNIGIGQQAQQIASQYGQQIANVGQRGAQFGSGQLTTGTSPVAEGNAAITAQTTAAQQQALATGESSALQGIGYQLTGQQQAATAANAAAGQANTGQQLQQSGLQSGAALQTPGVSTQQVGQGETVLGANGQPIANTPVIAPVGSQASYGVAPTTYNAQGQPTTAPVGAQTGATNTPFTAGQVQGEAQSGEAYQQGNAAITAAQGVQQKINEDIQTNGINSMSSVNLVNAANQYVQGNLSNANLTNFFNDLTEYTQTVAPLIGIGGSATDAKTFMAQQMIPQTASGSSITQILDNLNSLIINKNNANLSAGQGGVASGVQTPSGGTAGGSGGPMTILGVTVQPNPTTGLYEKA